MDWVEVNPVQDTATVGPLGALAQQARIRREVAVNLSAGEFRTECQVIVSLNSGKELGFEALTRPMGRPPLDRPDHFLEAAAEAGLLTETDRTWREASLARLGAELPAGQLLFLNVTPASLLTGHTTAPGLEAVARSHGLAPERIVLEVTEGERVDDFDRMRRVLGGFRSRGFLIAIDDAGAGPSSLQSMVELRPDFIKLDRWLARDIEFDRSRRSMVEALVRFAEQVRARVIAEGIETTDQLDAFIGLGVAFGQGYLLGMPGARTVGVAPMTGAHIRRVAAARRQRGTEPGKSRVADLAEAVPAIAAEIPGIQVHGLFQANPHLQVVAVVDGGVVAGIITRGRCFERMSGQFGLPLNGRKPAVALCTPATTVQATAVAQDAARLALERPPATAHDPVVVLDGRAYAGVVSTTGLLEQLLAEEVAEARLLSPLTGLPGNRLIRRRVEAARMGEEPYFLIYADIDNFKSFNDRFGFAHGDSAIAGLASVLGEGSDACTRESFLGHIGGDDFVAIVHAGDLAAFQRSVGRGLQRRWFDSGGRLAIDRVTVSLGGVPLAGAEEIPYEEIGAMVARVKHGLKASGGDRFAVFESWAAFDGQALAQPRVA